MANDQTKLRKPTWHKVSSIKPDIKRRNLIVKVVKVNNVEDQSFKEVIVGDESGVVTARFLEGQLSFAKQGNSLRLQNARVGMFKGHIRVECDKWSKLDTHEKQTWDPLMSNDVSGTEYELREN